MTSFQNLPEETLYLILGNLGKTDLQHCQKVCRFLYVPAHIMLLQDISLSKANKIERFINSIDYNPDPSYLKAVKTIKLRNTDKEGRLPVRYRLSKENIKKLFFRFPNLKKVAIYDSLVLFEEFDDDLCKELLKSCPKLDQFQDHNYSRDLNYHKTLYKLRHLLTRINLYNFSELEDMAQYITRFPRLKEIDGSVDQLDNIQKWLPVFQKLPHLSLPFISGHGGDQDNFAEHYLATLTTDEQTSLKQRLSKIDQLQLTCRSGSSKNAAKFVSKYLTNVQKLYLYANYESHWNISKQQEFCHDSFNFIVPAKSYGYIKFNYMTYDAIQRCFPIIMNRIVSQSRNGNRVLKIEAGQTEEVYEGNMELQATICDNSEICIFINDQLNLRDITSCVFWGGDQQTEVVPVYDIDEFILSIKYRKFYGLYTNVSMYLSLLQKLPSVKKVTLDVPNTFEKEKLKNEQETTEDFITNPQVEDLIIRASRKVRFQTLLDALAKTFPNLKRLSLCYSSGTWDQEKHELQVSLPEYTLETLIIDVTQLKRIMYKQITVKQREELEDIRKKHVKETSKVNKKYIIATDVVRRKKIKKKLQKIREKHDLHNKEKLDEMKKMEERLLKEGWFLVDARISRNNQRRLYKVSVNLLSVTSINQSDLQYSTASPCVVVIVGDLQCLNLCINYSRYDYYFHDGNQKYVKYVTLFDKNE